MNFKIKNREFTIKFTDTSYNLIEIKTVKEGKSIGEKREEIIGYFVSLANLFEKLVKITLAENDKKLNDFKDVLLLIEKMNNKLNELIKYKEN